MYQWQSSTWGYRVLSGAPSCSFLVSPLQHDSQHSGDPPYFLHRSSQRSGGAPSLLMPHRISTTRPPHCRTSSNAPDHCGVCVCVLLFAFPCVGHIGDIQGQQFAGAACVCLLFRCSLLQQACAAMLEAAATGAHAFRHPFHPRLGLTHHLTGNRAPSSGASKRHEARGVLFEPPYARCNARCIHTFPIHSRDLCQNFPTHFGSNHNKTQVWTPSWSPMHNFKIIRLPVSCSRSFLVPKSESSPPK